MASESRSWLLGQSVAQADRMLRSVVWSALIYGMVVTLALLVALIVVIN